MSVPDRFHISWKNDIAAYTLAADATVEAAYPLTNCQNKFANMWAVLDMTGETAVAITGSSATTRTATCFAVHNHNCPDGTTVRLRLYPNESQGGTPVFDSTATDVMHNIPFGSIIAGIDAIEGNFEDEGQMKTHFSLWFDSVEYKSFKIDIANTGGFTNNALRIDKLWLGFAYCPHLGPERGFESALLDDSEHQRKPGGGMETVQGDVRRNLNLKFGFLPNSERHVMRHIFDRAKKGGDLLITMDPNDAQSYNYETTSIYRRTSAASFVNTFYNSNDIGLSVEEN